MPYIDQALMVGFTFLHHEQCSNEANFLRILQFVIQILISPSVPDHPPAGGGTVGSLETGLPSGQADKPTPNLRIKKYGIEIPPEYRKIPDLDTSQIESCWVHSYTLNLHQYIRMKML
jgi:hypothetical protein